MATSDRVVIVTGASRGIGAAVAERLAKDGSSVAINSAGSEAPARTLADEICERGGKAIAVQADVNDPAAVAKLFDETEAAFGGVDALVNNAGIMKLAPIAACDDDTCASSWASMSMALPRFILTM